jgi:hypothetical protein
MDASVGSRTWTGARFVSGSDLHPNMHTTVRMEARLSIKSDVALRYPSAGLYCLFISGRNVKSAKATDDGISRIMSVVSRAV